MARTTRTHSTRTTNGRRSDRFGRFKNAIVQAGREPRETGRKVVNTATKQLERISEGLDQAAKLTRRAGDALEEMSQSLLNAAHSLRSTARTTGGSTSTRRKARTTTRSRTGRASGGTGGENLRVAGVGA